jgi:hypothetical protein
MGLDKGCVATFSEINTEFTLVLSVTLLLVLKRNENWVSGLGSRELKYNECVQKSIWNKVFFFFLKLLPF